MGQLYIDRYWYRTEKEAVKSVCLYASPHAAVYPSSSCFFDSKIQAISFQSNIENTKQKGPVKDSIDLAAKPSSSPDLINTHCSGNWVPGSFSAGLTPL